MPKKKKPTVLQLFTTLKDVKYKRVIDKVKCSGTTHKITFTKSGALIFHDHTMEDLKNIELIKYLASQKGKRGGHCKCLTVLKSWKDAMTYRDTRALKSLSINLRDSAYGQAHSVRNARSWLKYLQVCDSLSLDINTRISVLAKRLKSLLERQARHIQESAGLLLYPAKVICRYSYPQENPITFVVSLPKEEDVLRNSDKVGIFLKYYKRHVSSEHVQTLQMSRYVPHNTMVAYFNHENKTALKSAEALKSLNGDDWVYIKTMIAYSDPRQMVGKAPLAAIVRTGWKYDRVSVVDLPPLVMSSVPLDLQKYCAHR